ncbi:uncharacterized protein LOC133851019 [Alnus glutinosa]|uniref:uncharacterized protein LOC133851019 n=1 Tax=Alnus glutinosa TaxID=3517 RepID=UPI002D794C6B|nr:uncharacterized protein LOC133851019 [Alnus glutinosa]
MSKGPPLGTSSSGSSASSKRQKGEKNKRYGQHHFMGELFALPFLSKFPIPSDANASQTRILNDYYGVLMAYGGLQDFLREQEPGYVTSLVCTLVLPLYKMSVCLPYLVASANWVLGELAPCLPEERLFSFLCHLFYFFLSQGRSAYHLILAISHLLLPVLFLYT